MSTLLRTLVMTVSLAGGWGGTPVLAGPGQAPVKVAVIGDGETQALADLLMAELARHDACQMVERSELNRLGAEAALKQLGAVERPVALARLAQAHALVFLETKEPEPRKPAVAVRLVTAMDGQIRQTIWLPAEADAATNARLASARLVAMISNLNQGTSAAAVSLLGIRAHVPESALLDLETSVNALLAHRLSTYPGLVVLERWRMEDLAFERTLDKEGAGRLSTGAKLVNGSMKVAGGTVKVRLVVRPSESAPGVVADMEGEVARLPEVVERLAAQIAGVPVAASGNWKMDEEARTFGELGEWLLKHRLQMQAAQAFDSAVALGDRRTSTLIARVHAYSMCAYPDDLRATHSTDGGYRPGALRADSIGYHLEAAARAVHAAADIVPLEMALGEAQRPGLDNPLIVGRQILRATLCTLRAAHDLGVHVRHGAQTSALRGAMQRLVKALDATGMRQDFFYNLIKTTNAAYWCATPNETLAYYREVLAPAYGKDIRNVFKDGWAKGVRRGLSADVQRHGPMLDASTGTAPLSERLQRGSERLIDWQSDDQASVLTMWRHFIDSLKSSASPRDQADGLGFQIKAHRSQASRLQDLEEAAALLWRHRGILITEDGEIMLSALKVDFASMGAPPATVAPTLRRMLDLLCDLFEKETWVPRDWMNCVEWMTAGSAKLALKPEEVARLQTAMEGYRERTQGSARWQDIDPLGLQPMTVVFERAKTKLQNAWPAGQKPAGPGTDVGGPPPLVVKRLWHPARHAPQPAYQGAIDGYSLYASGGQFWLAYLGGGLVSVDDRTLVTSVWEVPSRTAVLRGNLRGLVSVPGRVYLTNMEGVWQREAIGGGWIKLDLPAANYQIQPLAKGVGISYGGEIRHPTVTSQGAGVGTLEAGKVQWIASTRRRPVEHPFDDAPVRNMVGVFPGTRAEPWVVWNQDVRLAVVHSLNADPASGMKFTNGLHVIPSGDRTLLFELFHRYGERQKISQMWNLRPDRDTPQLLMCDPDVVQVPAGTSPVWEIPEELRDNRQGRMRWFHPVLRGESVWVLRMERENYRDVKGFYSLVGFLPGRRVPVTVPLQFELQAEDLAVMSKNPLNDPYGRTLSPDCTQRSVVAGEHSLAISGSSCKGVWLVPWEDIEKWVKDHPGVGSGAQ